MAEQVAVLFGSPRVETWLALSRAYMRRLRQVAIPHRRQVDIGADPGRYPITPQEYWQRVQAAPVVGKVGHHRTHTGGPAHPLPRKAGTRPYVPDWVTNRGPDVAILQRVQLTHQLERGRTGCGHGVRPERAK